MTLRHDQLGIIVEILREAARLEVMPRFRSDFVVREKSSHLDLVTEADVAAEERITRALALAFPEALIVGEEACAADPGLLRRLGTAGRAILVDPIAHPAVATVAR